MKSGSCFRTAVAGVCSLVAVIATGADTNGVGGKSGPIPEEPVVRLGEILVVAPRVTRNPLATPTIESSSLDITTTTVEAEDIRLQNAESLAEAMDFSTGVLTERRGRKEKELTSFRGQVYPYPDFALNGVWQRAFTEVPSFFPAAAIDRIEILRTGGAIMVGPNSGLVGAINVVPRRFDEPTTLLDIEGGSYDTYRSSLVHGNRLDNADYTVGANFYSTGGPDGENAAERFSSFFGTGAWDPTETLHLEFTGYALTGERELRLIQDPGQKSLQTRRNEEFSTFESQGGILRALLKHNERASTEFDAGYVRRDQDYHYTTKDPAKPEVGSEERDWEYNAGVLHARRLGDANTVRLGAQYNHWICPDGKRYYVGNRMDVETFSGVIMDEQEWDRLTLDAGLRLTRSYYRDYTDNTIDMLGSTQKGSGSGASLFGNTIEDEWGDFAQMGTLGAKYKLARPVDLYAHAAVGGVDAPPGAVSETAESLNRETRAILDGGVSLHDPTMGSVKAGVFATFRQDAILLTLTEVTEDGETFNAYANKDVRQFGLELEFRSARLLEAFTLFGNATVMDSEQYVAGTWSGYREIPDFIAVAGVNSLIGRVDVNLFGKYVSGYESKRFAEDKKYHDLGDFVDLNLTAGVKLGREKNTRLYVSLENLLGDKYSTVVGFPDYGFQAFAGLQHRF